MTFQVNRCSGTYKPISRFFFCYVRISDTVEKQGESDSWKIHQVVSGNGHRSRKKDRRDKNIYFLQGHRKNGELMAGLKGASMSTFFTKRFRIEYQGFFALSNVKVAGLFFFGKSKSITR